MGGPGKSHRKGISLIELMDEMFPDEAAAVKWFESIVWPDGRCCGYCGSTRTSETPNGKPLPYWCTDCRHYFSVRTGTALARSHVSLRKWAITVYLCMTNLKGIASMKLHREIKVRQSTAWHMLHRIREAWALETSGMFEGPAEVDTAFVGGRAKSMHRKERKRRLTGRGGVDKTEVAGVKDRKTKQVRATVVRHKELNPDGRSSKEFALEHMAPGAVIYTDEAAEYKTLPNHEAVTHGAGEYVRGQVHVQGMESFWSMLKRAHTGTFHKLSPKHLNRYVQEFAGRHNIRDAGTLEQMESTVAALVGCRLLYRDLIADNGLPSGARPLRARST